MSLKIRRSILVLIGIILLLVGCLAAFFGPLEMVVFYFFSEGGRFAYEGFRFGSFMFGNLAAQILGYYFIAALLIPLGYGTLKMKSWAGHLSLAVIQFWTAAGLPLITAFFFVLLTAKEPTLSLVILTGILLGSLYTIFPLLVRRFYLHPDTRALFHPGGTWIEAIPPAVLGVGLVGICFILILHTQIFFNGIFPLFGSWQNGMTGIIMIDLSFLLLLGLIFGWLRLRRWAWWGTLGYYCLLGVSYLGTLIASSWEEILSALNLPAYEWGFLQGMPLHGGYLTLIAGPPFIITIIRIIQSRSFFHQIPSK